MTGFILSLFLRQLLILDNSAIPQHDYVEAVISVESSWDASAVSGKNAVGLMQLTPWAVKDVRREFRKLEGFAFLYATLGDFGPDEDVWFLHKCALPEGDAEEVVRNSLTDPALNIKIGTCYLSVLLRRYGGNWTTTLIAYNGGPAQVRKYELGQEMAQETANYVVKVEARRKEVRWLY